MDWVHDLGLTGPFDKPNSIKAFTCLFVSDASLHICIFSFGISWTAQNRCGFEGKGEIWVEDILNLGVS